MVGVMAGMGGNESVSGKTQVLGTRVWDRSAARHRPSRYFCGAAKVKVSVSPIGPAALKDVPGSLGTGSYTVATFCRRGGHTPKHTKSIKQTYSNNRQEEEARNVGKRKMESIVQLERQRSAP